MHARRHKNTNGTDTLVATGDGPRPANPPLPYGGRLGPYRLLCGVGTGSWSQVFQAVHAHSGHSQAIKLLRTQSRGDAAADPEACENTQPDAQAHAPADRPTASPGLSLLEQEADVARQVRHPNLVAVHEAHLQSPPYYIALEWIDGCGLDQWIEAQGKLPVPIALWLARQVAQALDALYRAGFMHGDIKPENIRVTLQGQAKVVDLGLARRLGPATGGSDRPTAGGADPLPIQRANRDSLHRESRPGPFGPPHASPFLAGTARYMAPELATTTHPGDIRSDLYSLGVTLYQMLTSRLPFPDADLRTTLCAHRQSRPRSAKRAARHLLPSVLALLRQLLAKDPLRRPQTPAELIDLLWREEIEALDYRLSA